MTEFTIREWHDQLQRAEAANWKEIIYRFIRPMIDLSARAHLDTRTLETLNPNWVLYGRGFPLIARHRWGLGAKSLAGKTMLIQGTGNGWDAVHWSKFHPKKIIAVDLYSFDSWIEIREYCARKYSVEVEFHVVSVEGINFLKDNSIDFIASDAVFEHIKAFDHAIDESYRILKQDGILYAGYGPLWFSPGGDHFSGRGGLSNSYNHLLLSKFNYEQYIKRHLNNQENFQSGVRYIELDLFSKLKTADYIKVYRKSGFKIDGLILELSPAALQFHKLYPERFLNLLSQNKECSKSDFLIRANFVRLQKLNRAG